jgi:hypothetical protein
MAAIALTAMFAVFGALIHLPLLLADAHSHLNWVMSAINLALTGAAWSIAGIIPRVIAPGAAEASAAGAIPSTLQQTNTHPGDSTRAGVIQPPPLNGPAGSRR